MREQGGQRRRTSVALLAKAPQPSARQRRDFPHQTALAVVRHSDPIDQEELRVRHRVQNHYLAKRIADVGWSAFLTILAFQAAHAGKRVIALNPAFTSQRG